MKHPILVATVSALIAVMLVVWGLWPWPGTRDPDRTVIALVMDTDIGVNAAVIRRGAQMAAEELKADLVVTALSKGESAERQLDLIRNQLDQGAKAVLLIPKSGGIVGEAIRLCGQRDAKLVLLDACEESRGSAPYVGTNHLESGIKAFDALCGIARIQKLMVMYAADPVSLERLQGIRLAAGQLGVELSAYPVSSCESTVGSAYIQALLQKNRAADAVVCLDGALTECAAEAIGAQALSGMTLVGFDCDQSHISCLISGEARFTVLRAPLAVGYEGFGCAVKLLNGDSIQPVEYIQTTVVMSKDAMDPEYVHLLFPLVQ